jgi:hypothetical protein
MVTTSTLSYAVDEVVSAIAFEFLYSGPFYLPYLYDVRPSGRRRERMASVTGIGMLEPKMATGELAEDTIANGYEKDFVHVTLGKQIPIEEEIAEDEEWGVLVDVGMQLADAAQYKMEYDAAAPFNDAFAGAVYKAEDGKSICNDSHTAPDGTNANDNATTATLNMAGLETARLAGRGFVNFRGLKAPARLTELLVPKELEMTGFELTKSPGKPDTMNNNINFYQGMFDMLVWDFLTDTNAWFLMDPIRRKMNLIWYMRKALVIAGSGNFFDGTKKVGAKYRASNGCRSPLWIVGSNPS